MTHKLPTRPTRNFRRMCEVYKIFADKWSNVCDFSETAMMDMFLAETHGVEIKPISAEPPVNGFLVGKHWLNVTVNMWLEDRARGELCVIELFEDKTFPKWWLKEILGDINWQNTCIILDDGH